MSWLAPPQIRDLVADAISRGGGAGARGKSEPKVEWRGVTRNQVIPTEATQIKP